MRRPWAGAKVPSWMHGASSRKISFYSALALKGDQMAHVLRFSDEFVAVA